MFLTFFSVFQEECDDLQEKVKAGLLEKLTIVKFSCLQFHITITLKHSQDVIVCLRALICLTIVSSI